jgi:hypothetical protein
VGPAKKELKSQNSTATLFAEALGDWLPLFQREELVGVATEGKYKGRPSIKDEIEYLDARLAENQEWNLGEIHFLLELCGRIRDIVTTYEAEGVEQIGDMKKMFESCTRLIQISYGNMAMIMQGKLSGDETIIIETGKTFDEDFGALVDESCSWNEIIQTCEAISRTCPTWKCLQSSTLLSPLYTDAIGIHDGVWWRFTNALDFGSIAVGTPVTETNGMAPKLRESDLPKPPLVGKVTEVDPENGSVAISWPEHGKHPEKVEKKRFRSEMKPFELALMKYNKLLDGVSVSIGPIKKLYRLIQKMLRAGNDMACAAIMDVVRATIVCDSNLIICDVLKLLAKDPSITI